MVSLAILVFSTDFKGKIFVCVFEQNQGVRVDMMMWSRSNRQSPLNWKMHENSLLWKNIQNMSAHTRHDSHSSQKGNVWEQEGVTDFFFSDLIFLTYYDIEGRIRNMPPLRLRHHIAATDMNEYYKVCFWLPTYLNFFFPSNFFLTWEFQLPLFFLQFLMLVVWRVKI